MRLSFQVVFALFALLSSTLFAADEDVASFEAVWKTVKEKHWDLAATGADWDHIHEIYLPKIKAAKTRDEARTLLTHMLGELKQSHFRIMESQVGDQVESLRMRHTHPGYPGFRVALVESRIFIVELNPESEAAQKGLAIGCEILKVNGEPVAKSVGEIVSAFKDVAHGDVYVPELVNGLLGGNLGNQNQYEVADHGAVRTLTLAQVKPKGEYKDLMNLSGIFYNYESKVLPDNLGYVTFNIFIPDATTAFVKDIQDKLVHTDGLIIDLRGNPGGMGILAVTIASRIVSEKGTKLGQMLNAGGTMNFPIFPQAPIYKKPVAVLIDGGSASTSEILAAGLQDLKRARVFGSRSAGAALPSVIVPLPNGDRFQYAIADYVTVAGRRLEGVGVVPDEVVSHSLDSMNARSDAALAAAQSWLVKQKLSE